MAGKKITYPLFENAVMALTSERFKKSEIQTLWQKLVDQSSPNSIDSYQFRRHFEGMTYRGNSSIKAADSGFQGTQPVSVTGMTRSGSGLGNKTGAQGRSTIHTVTASSS